MKPKVKRKIEEAIWDLLCTIRILEPYGPSLLDTTGRVSIGNRIRIAAMRHLRCQEYLLRLDLAATLTVSR